MPDCPFLSTFDNDVECYKECPLFNYKENGGRCPFTALEHENLNRHFGYDKLKMENTLEIIGNYY